jgi:hypothetical protein
VRDDLRYLGSAYHIDFGDNNFVRKLCVETIVGSNNLNRPNLLTGQKQMICWSNYQSRCGKHMIRWSNNQSRYVLLWPCLSDNSNLTSDSLIASLLSVVMSNWIGYFQSLAVLVQTLTRHKKVDLSSIRLCKSW